MDCKVRITGIALTTAMVLSLGLSVPLPAIGETLSTYGADAADNDLDVNGFNSSAKDLIEGEFDTQYVSNSGVDATSWHFKLESKSRVNLVAYWTRSSNPESYFGSIYVIYNNGMPESVVKSIRLNGSDFQQAPYIISLGNLEAGDYYIRAYVKNADSSAALTSIKVLYKILWSAPVEPPAQEGSKTMYRLYNPYSGEHFYTASADERDSIIKAGWRYEGLAWYAPEQSSKPVYRLYNPYVAGGDHHYTMNLSELDMLQAAGWKYEGIGWYSDEAEGTPLYRQYNPYADTGTHNYTMSKAENDSLVSLGWRAEGIAWYGKR